MCSPRNVNYSVPLGERFSGMACVGIGGAPRAGERGRRGRTGKFPLDLEDEPPAQCGPRVRERAPVLAQARGPKEPKRLLRAGPCALGQVMRLLRGNSVRPRRARRIPPSWHDGTKRALCDMEQ